MSKDLLSIFKKYKKRPVKIKALKLTLKVWDKLWGNPTDINNYLLQATFEKDSQEKIFVIETLEGVMKATIGDYLIIGIKGEIYPCKEDIFRKTYELVREE